jgi:hypothetical protein
MVNKPCTGGVILVLLSIVLLSSGCLTKEKNVDLVLSSKLCVDFEEDHDSENYQSQQYVNFYESLDDILSENGVSNVDVRSAAIVSGSYEVTGFDEKHHDWHITGSVRVKRADISDGPAVLIKYADVSLKGSLGTVIPAPLETAGVELLNRALADYVAGGSPQLAFIIESGDVEPDPSASDRIIFDWRACLSMQIICNTTVEVIDP